MDGKKGDKSFDNATKLAATIRINVKEVTMPINTDKPLWLDDSKSEIVVPVSFSYFL